VIDKGATVYMGGERPINSMLYFTSSKVGVIFMDSPNFFEPNTIVLKTDIVFFKVEGFLYSFSERTSATFRENCLFGLNLDSWLICRFV
jgi:hypothetical protein